jgi:Ca2+-transporting ATPase
LVQGVLIAAATALGFWTVYQGRPDTLDHARTVAFCILAYTQLFFSFACRSDRYTLPQLGLLTNPHLLAAILVSGLLQLSVVIVPIARPVFEVTSHPGREWLLVFALALAPVTIVEVAKLVLAAVKSWGSRAAVPSHSEI